MRSLSPQVRLVLFSAYDVSVPCIPRLSLRDAVRRAARVGPVRNMDAPVEPFCAADLHHGPFVAVRKYTHIPDGGTCIP
jgi:hypothetical protein